jgi:hypothetical protein
MQLRIALINSVGGALLTLSAIANPTYAFQRRQTAILLISQKLLDLDALKKFFAFFLEKKSRKDRLGLTPPNPIAYNLGNSGDQIDRRRLGTRRSLKMLILL